VTAHCLVEHAKEAPRKCQRSAQEAPKECPEGTQGGPRNSTGSVTEVPLAMRLGTRSAIGTALRHVCDREMEGGRMELYYYGRAAGMRRAIETGHDRGKEAG